MAGGEDVATIYGIGLDDCTARCCQQHCHAINYQPYGNICTMKTFNEELILSEDPTGLYNVAVIQEFQGNVIVLLIPDIVTHSS